MGAAELVHTGVVYSNVPADDHDHPPHSVESRGTDGASSAVSSSRSCSRLTTLCLVAVALVCGTVIGLALPALLPASSFDAPHFFATLSSALFPASPAPADGAAVIEWPAALPMDPLQCYGAVHVDWSDVCDSRYWEAIINVVLATHPQRDHSTVSQHRAKDSGTRRLYRVVLKLLCGHPIIVGTAGTSVSCGHGGGLLHGIDDPHLFSKLVHRYLTNIRPLTQLAQHSAAEATTYSNSSLGFWNGCMAGSGSDTASICLGSIFDAHSLQSAGRAHASTTLLPPLHDPRPDLRHPQYLPSAEYARHYNLSSVIPDLLLVEYVANDARSMTGRTLATPGMSREKAKQVKIDNMDRLLHRIWEYPTAAPLLVNTVWADHETDTFIALEHVYSAAQARHNIPSLDMRRHLGLNSSLNVSRPLSPTEYATFKLWSNQLFDADGLHPSLYGHRSIAHMITGYLSLLMDDLMDTITHFSSVARCPGLYCSEANSSVHECAAALLNSSAGATFEESAAARVWHHPASENAVCAMRWSLSVNDGLLIDHAAVSSHMFEWRQESSKLSRNKWAWSTQSRGAWLDFRLATVSGGQAVTDFSFAFLRSDWSNMSTSARVWITGTRSADNTLVNMSDVHYVSSKWSFRQSTIAVQSIPFSLPQSEVQRLMEPVVHFVNEDDNKFSLVGIFLRSDTAVTQGQT